MDPKLAAFTSEITGRDVQDLYKEFHKPADADRLFECAQSALTNASWVEGHREEATTLIKLVRHFSERPDRSHSGQARVENLWRSVAEAAFSPSPPSVGGLFARLAGAFSSSSREPPLDVLDALSYSAIGPTGRINPNIPFEDGRTALHLAIESGRQEEALHLIANGARNLPDDNGVTPLHLALKPTMKEVAKALLAKDPHSGGMDQEGYSPWDRAIVGGHTQLAVDLYVLMVQGQREQQFRKADALESADLARMEESFPGHMEEHRQRQEEALLRTDWDDLTQRALDAGEFRLGYAIDTYQDPDADREMTDTHTRLLTLVKQIAERGWKPGEEIMSVLSDDEHYGPGSRDGDMALHVLCRIGMQEDPGFVSDMLKRPGEEEEDVRRFNRINLLWHRLTPAYSDKLQAQDAKLILDSVIQATNSLVDKDLMTREDQIEILVVEGDALMDLTKMRAHIADQLRNGTFETLELPGGLR